MSALADAHAHCERVTRTQARNFSYGIRLLPPAKRQAMNAVYALARTIDDIADSEQGAGAKVPALDEIRSQLCDPTGAPADPVLLAVFDVHGRSPLPLEAFEDLLDGCRADAASKHFATFEELLEYCRCVAGSIGRLCLAVFGAKDIRAADPLADALGVALQLTNILRDLREDLDMGRVYLPAEDLRRHRVDLVLDADGRLTVPEERFAALTRFHVARAEAWFETGTRLLPLLDRRSAACCLAMAGVYRRLLLRLAADPAAICRGRVSLPASHKAVIAGRSLAGWQS